MKGRHIEKNAVGFYGENFSFATKHWEVFLKLNEELYFYQFEFISRRFTFDKFIFINETIASRRK